MGITSFDLTASQHAMIDDYISRKWPSREQANAWIKRAGLKGVWFVVESEENLHLPLEHRNASRLPLKEQAAVLGARVEDAPLGKDGTDFISNGKRFERKELAVANQYLARWRHSAFDEGAAILLFIGMAIESRLNEIVKELDWLADKQQFQVEKDYSFVNAWRFFNFLRSAFWNAPEASPEAQKAANFVEYLCASPYDFFLSSADVVERIKALDKNVDESSPYFNPMEYRAPHFMKYADTIWLLSQNMHQELFQNLVRNFYKFGAGSGWPDLTLIGDGEIAVCEVKDKDKLHQLQIAWWSTLAPVFGKNAWIAKTCYSRPQAPD